MKLSRLCRCTPSYPWTTQVLITQFLEEAQTLEGRRFGVWSEIFSRLDAASLHLGTAFLRGQPVSPFSTCLSFSAAWLEVAAAIAVEKFTRRLSYLMHFKKLPLEGDNSVSQSLCRWASTGVLHTVKSPGPWNIMWLFESIWLLFHLFCHPPPLLCQRRHISQTYSPHPARCSFINLDCWFCFFTHFIPVASPNSWCIFPIQFWSMHFVHLCTECYSRLQR